MSESRPYRALTVDLPTNPQRAAAEAVKKAAADKEDAEKKYAAFTSVVKQENRNKRVAKEQAKRKVLNHRPDEAAIAAVVEKRPDAAPIFDKVVP